MHPAVCGQHSARVGHFSIPGFSALFGVAGMILDAPLAGALTVVVQSLWVNETLGKDAPLAGSAKDKPGA